MVPVAVALEAAVPSVITGVCLLCKLFIKSISKFISNIVTACFAKQTPHFIFCYGALLFSLCCFL